MSARGRTSPVDVRVGHRIRAARLAQRISQREAAEAFRGYLSAGSKIRKRELAWEGFISLPIS
jgi:hypothetical protein